MALSAVGLSDWCHDHPGAEASTYQARRSILRIHVGNLSTNTGKDQLREAFTPHGDVLSVAVAFDRETERSRGFGFIEMPRSADAEAAITALDGSMLDGKLLAVSVARPSEPAPHRQL
jgi:RNA recognition motif-containing protein